MKEKLIIWFAKSETWNTKEVTINCKLGQKRLTWSTTAIVCYTAVFSVVTQRPSPQSLWGGALRSGKQLVIFSLDHAGKRPLACDWSCIYSCRHRISMKIGGRNTKSRLSLPFSFSRFSPLRLPFLHLPHWLFSLALLFASILSCFLLPWLVPERNYFRKPWDFFSFPKINYIKPRKISTRQGF